MSQTTSGKHMICDIKNITNHKLLSNPDLITDLLDNICQTYNYTILQKSHHIFEPKDSQQSIYYPSRISQFIPTPK